MGVARAGMVFVNLEGEAKGAQQDMPFIAIKALVTLTVKDTFPKITFPVYLLSCPLPCPWQPRRSCQTYRITIL